MNLKDHLSNPIFNTVAETAREMNISTFTVGGYVRDILLKRVSKDIDILTVGNGIDLATKVAEKLHANVSVFKNFGTAMINSSNEQIEFVGARKESYNRNSRKPVVENGTLEDDLSRRDFTINALAISLNQSTWGEVVDMFGGLADLEKKIIRTPLEPNITYSDDPLRMMRAIRFATQLGFEIEAESFNAIKENKDRITIVSQERITDEMQKILMAAKPSIGFKLLFDTGLLEYIFPQLVKLHGVDIQNGQMHKDNFYHTIEVVDNIARATDNIWLRWAALLHDIAKPATKRYDARNGWTFHGHEFIGHKMIPDIFKQLKLPLNEKMKYVQKLVLLHLRPISLVDEIATDSAVRRLLFEAGEDIEDLMTLCEADITSKNPNKIIKHLKNFEQVRIKLKETEEQDKVRNWQPPITGQEIMDAFNLPAGREVGIIKNAIREAILDGVIANDFDEAYKFMTEKGLELGLKIAK